MDWLDTHNLRHWLADAHEDYFTRTTLGEPQLEEGTPCGIPPFHVPREVREKHVTGRFLNGRPYDEYPIELC